MKIIDAHVHLDRPLWESQADPSAPPPVVLRPEDLIRQLDEAGVEKAVIMQHPVDAINDVVVDTLRKHPGRFRGAMIVPLDEDVVAVIEQNHAVGLTVIKIDMYGTTRLYPGIRLDSELLNRIYATAERLGIVVAVDPFRPGDEGYQPDDLEHVVIRYPALKFVICHLGFCDVEALRDVPRERTWRAMAALARHDNVWFDVSAMPDMFAAVEDYPFFVATQFVREFADEYGVYKLLWGSDILGELRRGSYRELIDMFALSKLFTDDEKELLFHANADAVYFGKTHRKQRSA